MQKENKERREELMEAFKIWCETNEEYHQVLAKMKEEDIKWKSDHEIGSGCISENLAAPIGLTVTKDKLVGVATSHSNEHFEQWFASYKTITSEEYLKEGNKMGFSKKDLQTGHIVTLRNGTEAVVIKGIASVYQQTRFREGVTILEEDILLNENKTYWEPLVYYTDELTMPDSPARDIVKVELICHPYSLQNFNYAKEARKLVWERKEKMLTMDEVMEILYKKFPEYSIVTIIDEVN